MNRLPLPKALEAEVRWKVICLIRESTIEHIKSCEDNNTCQFILAAGWNVEGFFTKKFSGDPKNLYNKLKEYIIEEELRTGFSGFQDKCQLWIAEDVVNKLKKED